MGAVIHSLLDTDLYKFTMWQTLLHRHPETQAEVRFVCRNPPAYPLAELKAEVERELDALCALGFAADELDYLRGLRFMKSDFVDFLRIFRFQRNFIEASAPKVMTLRIVARGPQVHVMALRDLRCSPSSTSSTFAASTRARRARPRVGCRLQAKIQAAAKTSGTSHGRLPPPLRAVRLRRAPPLLAREWQREVVRHVAQAQVPAASSRAPPTCCWRKRPRVSCPSAPWRTNTCRPTRRSAPCACATHQKAALEDWVQEYRGDLGIALTDVVGMDAFLADFDLYFAKLFDGLRHDSGDPTGVGRKSARALRRSLRIDPHTKRLVFSATASAWHKALALYRALGRPRATWASASARTSPTTWASPRSASS